MYDNDYVLTELIRIKKEELDREMQFKETYKLYSDCDKHLINKQETSN